MKLCYMLLLVGKQVAEFTSLFFLCYIRSTTDLLNLLTYILTYLLISFLNLDTPCSRVHLEKLTGSQLVKNFPTFHETWRFITAFTSARHVSLIWPRIIQSIPPHPTSWRSILILSPHLSLGLPSGIFPSGFPTKILYTPLLYPIRATCPSHLLLFDLITHNNIWWRVQITNLLIMWFWWECYWYSIYINV
jgi:hypothetical protein